MNSYLYYSKSGTEIEKENLKQDTPGKVIPIHHSKSHHLELILPPEKTTSRRFKNLTSLVRWYVHPRFWKQILSGLVIYTVVFAIWFYWCKS